MNLTIKQIERVKKRYRVTTTTGSFLLEEDTIVHFRLLNHKSLSEDEWQEILQYDERFRALAKAYHYLSFKPRSVAQMKDYLRRKEIIHIDPVITTLKQKGYLDDASTAQWIVEQTLLQKKGANAAKTKMIQAKIHSSLIDQALATMSREDAAVAAGLKLQGWCKPTKKSLQAFQASLLQKLLAAGFSYEIAKDVLRDHKEQVAAQVDEAAAIAAWLSKNASLTRPQQINKLMQQGFSYSVIQRLIEK